jgi:hypothetical protein
MGGRHLLRLIFRVPSRKRQFQQLLRIEAANVFGLMQSFPRLRLFEEVVKDILLELPYCS